MSILPPNSTLTELALDETTARIGAVPVPNADLWNPATCSAAFLPWLAYALSVDNWEPEWTEETKRAVIAAAIELHRRKGTVAAIRAALSAAGYGGVQVIERFGWHDYDGTHLHDGSIGHEPRDHWAEYRLVLSRPLAPSQLVQVQNLLALVTPARCHLVSIAYTDVDFLYNAAILHDGAQTHGA